MQKKKHITIIGAGMGGCLMAIYLAQKQFTVDIFESREDITNLPNISNRSISQYLSARGVYALQKAGIWKEIKKLALEDTGNIFHQEDNSIIYKPYGKKQHLREWSINRNELNKGLLTAMRKYPNIHIFFQMRLLSANFSRKTIRLENIATKEKSTKKIDLLIGSDGIRSAVRKSLSEKNYTKDTLELSQWGFKNILIPMPSKGKTAFSKHAFHIWQRKGYVVFSTPNRNGLFTYLFNLPLQGKISFASLTSKTAFLNFIREHFRDLYPFLASHANEFIHTRAMPFRSFYTSQWYYKDFVVLLGDACHAVPYFYSQGINAAFEDCRILSECLDTYLPDFEKAFAMYQELRKPNIDILTDLCTRRLQEYKNKYNTSLFTARNRIESSLEHFFPNHFHALYTLIVHTTLPYGVALRRYYRERKMTRLLGIDILVYAYALLLHLTKMMSPREEGHNSLKKVRSHLPHLLSLQTMKNSRNVKNVV